MVLVEKEQLIQAGGHQLNTLTIGGIRNNKPTLVFVHGGLDCIPMWRSFPAKLAAALGLPAVVYDRWGHGKSEPLETPRLGDPRWDEAGETMADLFQLLGLKKVILVGHSFGGAVSLLAGSRQSEQVIGIVAMAPQFLMHDACIDGLDAAKKAFSSGKLRSKLEPFHGDKTDTLFWDWTDRALSDEFNEIDHSTSLQKISCPVLQIYGQQDNYGYLPNKELIDSSITGVNDCVEIPKAGHYPHLEATTETIEAIAAFVDQQSLTR